MLWYCDKFITEPLTHQTLRRLVDNPDFFYSQHDFPADLEFVAQVPGLLAGLQPLQRLRLAAIDPHARQAIVGMKPPELDHAPMGVVLGAALSAAPARSSSLSTAQSSVADELRLAAGCGDTPAVSGLVELRDSIAAQLAGWGPLAQRATLSLRALAEVETPTFLAAALAHDSAFRRAHSEALAPQPWSAPTARAHHESITAGANTVTALVKCLQPLWSEATSTAAADDVAGALSFFHDVLLAQHIHALHLTAEEAAQMHISDELIGRFCSFLTKLLLPESARPLVDALAAHLRQDGRDGAADRGATQRFVLDTCMLVRRLSDDPLIPVFFEQALAPYRQEQGRLAQELTVLSCLQAACGHLLLAQESVDLCGKNEKSQMQTAMARLREALADSTQHRQVWLRARSHDMQEYIAHFERARQDRHDFTVRMIREYHQNRRVGL